MIFDHFFTALLVFATITTTLVAGLVLTFAIIVMPGLRTLSDREFIRSFRAMDGIIQNNEPTFITVWLGSMISLMAVSIFGIWHLDGLSQWLLITACVIYVAGVQLPTLTINVPLNNHLQLLPLDEMNADSLVKAREQFEDRWNRWNAIRTVVAVSVSILLILVILA